MEPLSQQLISSMLFASFLYIRWTFIHLASIGEVCFVLTNASHWSVPFLVLYLSVLPLLSFAFHSVSHILDDFIFLSPANSPLCKLQLDTFLAIASFAGIPIKASKTVKLTQAAPISLHPC